MSLFAVMFHVNLNGCCNVSCRVMFFLICIFNFCATVSPVCIVTSLKIYIFLAQLYYIILYFQQLVFLKFSPL